MRRLVTRIAAVVLVLVSGVALAGLPIKAPKGVKVDKDALAGAAQDKVVKELLSSVNGSFGDLAAMKPAAPFSKGLFDLSSMTGAADEQMKAASEQTAKVQGTVENLKKKKGDLTKAADQVRKQAAEAKGDGKAAAEKTLGELEGAISRIDAMEAYSNTMTERQKDLEGQLGELKALSAKSSSQSAAFEKRMKETATAAGVSVE